MICPILSMGQNVKRGCEEEECGHWDATGSQCSQVTIACELRSLRLRDYNKALLDSVLNDALEKHMTEDTNETG